MKRWAKITKIMDKAIRVKDCNNGDHFDIIGEDFVNDLANGCYVNHEAKQELIPLTRAAEILSTSYEKPFSVCFTKADGTERQLTGRLLSTEPLLGRSFVEDLELVRDRIRLVDHRTIKWIIVDDTFYVVK